MSYSLSLYLVDLQKARGAIGSGDDKLRRMIGGVLVMEGWSHAHPDDLDVRLRVPAQVR